MAISKQSVYKNTPVQMGYFPEATDHQPCPAPYEGCSCPPAPIVHLCNNFDDAVSVAGQVFLSPGETHTEFYKDSSSNYHCVLAVGNINAGKGHLILTDTGSTQPFHEQIKEVRDLLSSHDISVNSLQDEVQSIENTLSILNTSIGLLQAHADSDTANINVLNTSVAIINEDIADINEDLAIAINDISANKADISNNVKAIQTINGSISVMVDDIRSLRENVSSYDGHFAAMDASVKYAVDMVDMLDVKVSGYDASINILNVSVNNIENILVNVNASLIDNAANIHDVSMALQTQVSDINGSIDAINGKLYEVSTDIDGIYGMLGQHDGKLNNINTSLNTLAFDITETKDDVSANAYDISVNAGRIDSIVGEVSDINLELDNIDSSIMAAKSDIAGHAVQLSQHDEAINIISSDISSFKEDTSVNIGNINSSINDMNAMIDDNDSSIRSLSNALTTTNTSLHMTDSVLNNVANHVDKVEQDIAVINASVNDNAQNIDINTANINILNVSANMHDAQINVLNTSINLLENAIEMTDSSVISMKSDISGNKNDISIINNAIININSSIYADKTAISIIDASVNRLEAVVDMLADSSLSDASVKKLFSDDIYTVNLCCYTNAGHIELVDTYDSGRVAESTPRNEYKTYVTGDEVVMTAKVNHGYKFSKWLKNGSTLTTDTTITYTFMNSDVDVIGTLNDGIERDILANGYTALYRQMHNVQVSILYTNTHEIEGDAVAVYIDGVIDGTDDHLFDDGSQVKLVANPIQYHNFKYFDINGITVNYSPYVDNPVYSLKVKAYFEEEQHWLYAETKDEAHGNIQSDLGVNMLHRRGKTVKIWAVPETGHTFDKWIYGDTRQLYSTDQTIYVTIGGSDISLVALFN